MHICSLVGVQGYKLPYMHICRPYMYILNLDNIYMGYIYIFHVYFLFAWLLLVVYLQIDANEC